MAFTLTKSSPAASWLVRPMATFTITTSTTVIGSDQPVLTGNVEISSEGKLLTTVPVGANGEATWTTKDLPTGDDRLSATFLDTTNPSVAYRASGSHGIKTQVVNPCSPAPSFVEQPVDLTATYGTSVVLSASVSVSPGYGGTPQVKWQTSTTAATPGPTPQARSRSRPGTCLPVPDGSP